MCCEGTKSDLKKGKVQFDVYDTEAQFGTTATTVWTKQTNIVSFCFLIGRRGKDETLPYVGFNDRRVVNSFTSL